MQKPYPTDIITTWNPTTGEFTVSTGDKSLDGQFKFFQVMCISTLSTIKVPAVTAFPISFIDECKQATVIPPRILTYNTILFLPKTIQHAPARVIDMFGNPLSCGGVTNTLTGVEQNYPDVEYFPDTRELYVLGTDPVQHVDQFPLQLLSCITIKGSPFGCKKSQVFRVIINNPCDNSQILSNTIPSTMVAAINSMDFMDLTQGPTFWPFVEQFTVDSDVYANFCLPYQIDIVLRNTNDIVPFVSFDQADGMMKMQPTLDEAVGLYQLTMKIKLFVYPDYNVIAFEDFDVVVTECLTQI